MRALCIVMFFTIVFGTAQGAAVDLTGASAMPDPQSRDIPQTIWFQGFVEDSGSGAPVDATYDIVAEIFDADVDGTSLWGPELHSTTIIVDGWFNIELGATVDLPTFGSPPYYLELSINGETLFPRQKLGSVPASFRSARTDDIDDDWYYYGANIYRVSGFTGIGTTMPERDLDVVGTVRMDEFEMVPGAVSGHVLTSDAGGVGTWQEAPGGGGFTLPYSGSVNFGESAFRVDNTSTLAAASAVMGQHTVSGSYGRLGGASVGVYGYAEEGDYAGRFDGRVYVTDRLGVGTMTPQNALHLRKDSGGDSGIWIENHNTTAQSFEGIFIGDENGMNVGLAAYDDDHPDHPSALSLWNTRSGGMIQFETGGSERMRIENDGSVGIGTATPDAPLHVVSVGGKAIHGRADVLDDNAHYGVYGETESLDGYGVYGQSRFAGVGAKNTDTNTIARLGYGSTAVWGYDGETSYNYAGYFDGKVHIDGDLGIGTTDPSSRLDVDGIVRVRNNAWPPSDTGASMELAYSAASHRGYVQVYDRASGGQEWGQLYLGGGHVGIGISTDYSHLLDVAGAIQCETLFETSDGAFKTDVRELANALDAVERLRGVSFVWNEESASAGATPGERGIGVIAQEVEEVFPELVSSPEGSHKAVDYSKLTAVLIQAVKELRAENEALSARLDALEAPER